MTHDEAYREAVKKIKKARLDRATALNLSNNKLWALPESVGQLTQLQSLNLASNQLTALPESLGQITQLQSLSLADNELTSLPESLGQLTQLRSLDLTQNGLSWLPQCLGRLAQLRSLDVSENKLTVLPESLDRLTQLQSLNLASNQLTALPKWIGQLTHLQSLDLSMNELTELPESLNRLEKLAVLVISCNRFTSFPPVILSLSSLTELYALDNQIPELPSEIATLSKLCKLILGGQQIAPGREYVSLAHSNQLSSLPTKILQLTQLTELWLDGNPLNPELAAAYKMGLDAVKNYLRELEKGARKRFEAKLLILGDGNEGKTCVSRALRGLPFEDQPTTRGVDVEQWMFSHPDHPKDKEKRMTLNIWDFEGQEINHQTHQFFLTTDSLYVLVFKCRDQFLLERAEYWLDTIRARAPEARVAIVITECENRTPYVPEDKLQSEYGDVLIDDKWLFAVGCENKSGIPGLRKSLKRLAADLSFMGRDWPDSYSRAESAIKEQGNSEIAHIDRSQLHAIFAEATIGETSFEDIATFMATLGVITQFPDCPDLRNFIVLQPQWLTKAMSEIMEDSTLAHDRGEISLQRMQEVWGEKGYEGLFATFHNCMKEFELCYDLDNPARSCLVPLRFGYVKPEIPWTSGEDLKERRVNYKLNIHPPTGLMSRLIVKTHHMIASTGDHPNGVYWHNGVFLRTGKGPLCSEALCEFDRGERMLSVTVRAAFPQNMIEQIHAYVKAVFSFFKGLEPERSYGCIRVDEKTDDEEQCGGMHSERRIYSAILKNRILDCEHEFHDVDPRKLIWALSSFGDSIQQVFRTELDKTPAWAGSLVHDISTLLAWANQNNQLLEQVRKDQETLAPDIAQEMEQKLREYLGYFGQMLDDRDFTSAPGIISINTVDRSPWNPRGFFRKKYILTPFCECEHNVHPCKDGCVEFSKDWVWWAKTAPWIARGTKVLSVGLQLGFAGMPLAMPAEAFEAVKKDVVFMSALTKHLELKADDANESAKRFAARFKFDTLADMRKDDNDARLMRTALSRFLEEVAPDNYRAKQWGSLRRVRMSDNSYRWLCKDHAK